MFGGSFNPIHKGHLASLDSVLKGFDLERIQVLPVFKHPFQKSVNQTTKTQRLCLLEIALKSWDRIHLDTRELDRRGISYTIDTINSFLNESPQYELYWIMGVEQLKTFHKWHNFKEILEKTNFIITSRGVIKTPACQNDLPLYIRPYIACFNRKKTLLNTGKTIYWFNVHEVEVSSRNIREKIKQGKPYKKDVTRDVYEVIKKEKLFQLAKKPLSAKSLAQLCSRLLRKKLNSQIEVYKFMSENRLFDFVLIASAKNTKHASAIADYLVKAIKKKTDLSPLVVEGRGEGHWIVLDYNDLIIHIFYDYVRQRFEIPKLWESMRMKPSGV